MKIITAAERAARRGHLAPNTAAPANHVAWRKKGCATCRPIVVPVRPAPPISLPTLNQET